MADGYDPRKSKVSEDSMQAWRNSQPTDDLLEIPGIGPAAVKKLGEAMIDAERITNTYMLFGKYLSLKGPDLDGHKVDIVEHNERFWHYLKIRGISAHRSAIVKVRRSVLPLGAKRPNNGQCLSSCLHNRDTLCNFLGGGRKSGHSFPKFVRRQHLRR
jgi:hypothetical protein